MPNETGPEDLRRDLAADLALCAATRHPAGRGAAAREGWPAAIRRALAAEAELAKLTAPEPGHADAEPARRLYWRWRAASGRIVPPVRFPKPWERLEPHLQDRWGVIARMFLAVDVPALAPKKSERAGDLTSSQI